MVISMLKQNEGEKVKKLLIGFANNRGLHLFYYPELDTYSLYVMIEQTPDRSLTLDVEKSALFERFCDNDKAQTKIEYIMNMGVPLTLPSREDFNSFREGGQISQTPPKRPRRSTDENIQPNKT